MARRGRGSSKGDSHDHPDAEDGLPEDSPDIADAARRADLGKARATAPARVIRGAFHGCAQLLILIRREWINRDQSLNELVARGCGSETGGFEKIGRDELRAQVGYLLHKLRDDPDNVPFVLPFCDASLRDRLSGMVRLLDLDLYHPDIDGEKSQRWQQPWTATGLDAELDELVPLLYAAGDAAMLREVAHNHRDGADSHEISVLRESLADLRQHWARAADRHSKSRLSVCLVPARPIDDDPRPVDGPEAWEVYERAFASFRSPGVMWCFRFDGHDDGAAMGDFMQLAAQTGRVLPINPDDPQVHSVPESTAWLVQLFRQAWKKTPGSPLQTTDLVRHSPGNWFLAREDQRPPMPWFASDFGQTDPFIASAWAIDLLLPVASAVDHGVVDQVVERAVEKITRAVGAGDTHAAKREAKLPKTRRGFQKLAETTTKDQPIIAALNEGKRYRAVAQQCGVSKSTVGRVAKAYGLTGHTPESVPLGGTLEENLSIRGKPGKRRKT